MSDLAQRARNRALEHREEHWYTSDCNELLDELADEIERLQAIVDRQHSALVVAGFECDYMGDCDLHVLAMGIAEENEREDGEPTDDDYAESYMRAVERLRASVAKTA